MPRLFLASCFTLGLICSLSFGFVLFLMIASGEVDFTVAIAFTLGMNFLIWLLGPFFTDLINKWIYKVQFLTPEEFKKKHPEMAELIQKICTQYQFKFPKIGIISDKNPTAFTYGSGRYNARLIFTEGIPHFLTIEEQKAVIAHEMGHIVHRDFIVMMVASVAVQTLYEIYAALIRAKGKKAQNAKVFALIAYVLYLICIYLLLYLSRTREYMADRFSTEWTQPKELANALVKIAYGIVSAEDDSTSKRLLQSTRHLGIVDVKNAKHIGVVSYITGKDAEAVTEVMVFDRVNPWAKLIELNSTHPLTGNRMDHLSDISKEKQQSFPYDIDAAVDRMKLDKPRLYKNFFVDLFMGLFPFILTLACLPILPPMLLSGVFGIGLLLQIFYKYPQKNPVPTTVLEEMRDPYLSPMRGKAVTLEGQVIGQGVPGYIFSEDMMYQDKTGMTFTDYSSAWGFIGNLFFAITKLKNYFSMPSHAKGWFFRGMSSHLKLDSLQLKTETVQSYPRLWPLIFSGLFIGFSVVSWLFQGFYYGLYY